MWSAASRRAMTRSLRRPGRSAAEAGINAVQIGPVSQRAGVATGTVYRYFPSKTDLVAALVASVSERELGAMRRAADAAPGPLSALAAAITTFAARALANPRLAFALIAEQADGAADEARLAFRSALAAEFSGRLTTAMKGGHLPDQDVAIAAPGAARRASSKDWSARSRRPRTNRPARDAVQAITLFALRAVGVADARARGLVVQARHAGAAGLIAEAR